MLARSVILLMLANGAILVPANDLRAASTDPIQNQSTEQAKLIPKLPDGGLPPVVGVQNVQVFRASRAARQLTDGKGWTYNHHVDMGCFKGRLYVAWENGEKDEDIWPGRELYSTSEDGFTWSEPAELFPSGVATPLRMYFFHASNGRMLAIAGLRVSHEKTTEEAKRGAVVREIIDDHTLGPIFTLITDPAAGNPPPSYRDANDAGFVQACEQLLANKPFLEQADYGNLLGDRRMAAYQNPPRNFGKAFTFFHRKDGALVGIGKRGWVVVSNDEGNTWSAPVHPESIITGNAKQWVQRTSDGRYAMAYIPHPTDRFPLTLVSSNDGIIFRDMRVIHGEVPPLRYPGTSKSIGPQYVRGVSEWAGDGSFKDRDAMWVVYSVNKEDIWVSRIPVPVKIEATSPREEWNTYRPKWGEVRVAAADAKGVELEDRDPYDYARADRLFAESEKVTAEFDVMMKKSGGEPLEIELNSPLGHLRPVQIKISSDGKLEAAGKELGNCTLGEWKRISINADAATQRFSLSIDGKQVASELPFAERAQALKRLTFRTGNHRLLPEAKAITPETDVPTPATIFCVREVKLN